MFSCKLTHFKYIVDVIFSLSLFLNAAVFIPQSLAIWRQKSAKGVSVITFLGFNVMQFFAVLHGYFAEDYLLMVGFLLSFITCGVVTCLAWRYK